MHNPFRRNSEKRLAKLIEQARQRHAITALLESERKNHPEQRTCQGFRLIPEEEFYSLGRRLLTLLKNESEVL